MDRRASIDEWISLVARIVGLIGLVAFGVKWFVTAQIEPVLVASAGGLYGLGKAGEALAVLRREPPRPPLPDSSTGEPRKRGDR